MGKSEREHHFESSSKEAGFSEISVSHRVMPMIKAVPRGTTTVVDAYLTPSIKIYVDNFKSGFADQNGLVNKLLFMRSDGGLTPVKSFFGSRAVLSGPAGGVALASYISKSLNENKSISLDIGGTTAKICYLKNAEK